MAAKLKFAVIGDPIQHSCSPLIHGAAMENAEISAEFLALKVSPEQLESWLENELSAFEGVAVTVPHKGAVAKIFRGKLEPAAQAIGAVNTLFKQGEAWHATNTDALGFWVALEAFLAVESVPQRPALVLGAGGAARAVGYMFAKHGWDFCVWNRTPQRAVDLCQSFGGSPIEDWNQFSAENWSVVINTTSAALHQSEPIIPSHWWRDSSYAFDLSYGSHLTPFLAAAKSAGAQVMDGKLMLIEQAKAQFSLWHRQPPMEGVMEKAFFAAQDTPQ